MALADSRKCENTGHIGSLRVGGKMARLLLLACVVVAVLSPPLLRHGRAEGRVPEQAWGPAYNGLSIALASDSTRVPLGTALDLQLLFRFDPAVADTAVAILNTAHEAYSLRLLFRNMGTGEEYERRPFDIGMPHGIYLEDRVELRKTDAHRESFRIHLLSSSGEQIPPGRYDVVAWYANDAGRELYAYCEPETDSYRTRRYERWWELWRGVAKSAPIPLEIHHADPQEETFEVPMAIAVRPEQGEVSKIVFWVDGGYKNVTIAKRPGYHLGSECKYLLYVGGERLEPSQSCVLPSGSGGGPAYGCLHLYQGRSSLGGHCPELYARVQAGEKMKLVIEVRLFETSVPSQHMWMPERGDYRVLWTESLEAVWLR
jgi:hypothetical protein